MSAPVFQVQHYIGGAWVDFVATGDIRLNAPIVCDYGIKGGTVNDRIASPGRLEYPVDNSALNSGGLVGYYAPLHASKRTGWDYNLPVRLKITYGANWQYKFRGRLSDIVPTPGLSGDLLSQCVAADWMDDASEIDLPDLETQLGQRDDQILTTIFAALAATDRPIAASIDTGVEAYAFSLDGGASRRPTLLEALNLLAMSGFAYGYVRGDQVQGGTFQWENRHYRSANPTVKWTLTDAELEPGAFELPGSRRDIYRSVRVAIHPLNEPVTATVIVLWSLQNTSTYVGPGETLATIFGGYFDPDSHERIGGYDASNPAYDPQPTVDYTMNTAQDGSGVDCTASFTVASTRTGLGVRFGTIRNNGSVGAYITKLQQRGKPIYRYDLPLEKTIAGSYGTRTLEVDLPYQNDINVANDLLSYLIAVRSGQIPNPPTVRFLANVSATLMQAAILGEPGDRIAITETATGLDHEFTINGVRLECHPSGLIYCTWTLEPADMTRYWLWGIPGASEWDLATRYGW